jgi:streptogramin lyase
VRIRILNFILFIPFLLCSISLWAQPNISYTPTSNIYTAGTAITTITPGNSGGAVATIAYAAQTNFATVTDPYSVATDASGNVFAINGTSGALYKFNSAGTGGTINTAVLNSPAGVVVDNSGNVWVTDFTGGASDAVYEFSATGTLLNTITGFSSPYGIAVDGSNNIFVANSGTSSIIKIAAGTTTKSNYITGMASAPYGITFDPSGNMFISENNANAIVKVAAGGTTVSAFFSTSLSGPRHLAADNAGNIYVSDYGNSSLPPRVV